MKKMLLLLCLGSLTVTGCAGGRSDSLGLGKDAALTSYTDSYRPARDMLREGKFTELAESMNKEEFDKDGNKLTNEEQKEALLAKASELSLMERGLITLNSGDFTRALHYFTVAETRLEQEESAVAKGVSVAGKGFLAGLTGAEEATDYAIRGYEKVMLLNYQALCHMLLGDRKAYNVTRRAIEKQQEEWEAFKTMVEQAKAKEKEETANKGDGSLEGGDTRDKYTQSKAASVASAFVNPFGDYMDGMIMEIDSVKDGSLRDNAAIAYKKALELNPQCTAAKQAAAQMKKNGAPKGQKLVQVLLSDGFSPEKQILTSAYRLGELTAVVNYTQMTPIPSRISSATVNKSAMSLLSDMEAIILRDDQDRAPFRNVMFAAAVLRSGALSYLGGADLAKLGSKLQKPDTRSWLSLPGKILVARMYVPMSAKQVSLQTRSGNSKSVKTTSVPLAAKGPTVIYAVSFDDQLQAYANKNSWIEQ